ncbi:hypothetical protein HZA40_05025 [Candidatus Peregrinibacteria bacterium]|nr:hypothetical protein [Candidatus Peregrinibacteria bacterium]
MPDNSQNSGGQAQHGQTGDQHLEKQKPKSEGGDFATNIWHKIEDGAASKAKIGDFKQELGHKKRRRRRRRKKHGPDSNQNQQQQNVVKPVQQEPVQQEPVQPEPIQPEPVPPTPPVAPINPFDFGPPNTTISPTQPDYANSKDEQKNEQYGEQPINPFDLTDPASSVEEKKHADMSHRVTPVDEGVYEETSSPEDTGESDEFKAINSADSDENADREEEIEVDEKKDDVIDVPPEDVMESKIEPVFPEKLDVKEDFWTILEHAGITKKKLIIFGGVLLVLIVVGLFFIFGGKTEKPVERSTSVPVQNQVVAPTPQETKNQRPYDVIAAYIFGLEYQSPNGIQAQPMNSFGDLGGVDAGIIFGTVANLRQAQFVEYEQVLEKMNNIYNVDIYSMLDLSVDRRATLDKYLKDMDALITQGTADLANIEIDLAQFKTQYDAFSKQSGAYETAFYNYAKSYYGQTAYDNLQLFMDTANQAARIKAQHGAENTLKTMFINSLNALKPRYQDISANTEALIKGVKVFDIKNSDIKAILPVK